MSSTQLLLLYPSRTQLEPGTPKEMAYEDDVIMVFEDDVTMVWEDN
jgi:hypothetical protein